VAKVNIAEKYPSGSEAVPFQNLAFTTDCYAQEGQTLQLQLTVDRFTNPVKPQFPSSRDAFMVSF
jgi:hypothetical protein